MEINIAIETYSDIFSDFDNRDFKVRALSKDFLEELHVRLRRIGAKTELKIVFQIPASRRDRESERLIIERLRGFYIERRTHYERESRIARMRAVVYVSIGLLLMAAADLLVKRFTESSLFNDFLLIPSWFFVWSGFDILAKRGETRGKKKYYDALALSATEFESAEVRQRME